MLTPMFKLSDLEKQIGVEIEDSLEEIAEGFALFGEQYVNDARTGGSYKDQTGNLRASNGYVVSRDKKRTKTKFDGGKPTGEAAAASLASEVLKGEPPDSLVLIGVAGMEYAGEVESRGYSVMTPFIPRDEDVRALLKDAGLTPR